MQAEGRKCISVLFPTSMNIVCRHICLCGDSNAVTTWYIWIARCENTECKIQHVGQYVAKYRIQYTCVCVGVRQLETVLAMAEWKAVWPVNMDEIFSLPPPPPPPSCVGATVVPCLSSRPSLSPLSLSAGWEQCWWMTSHCMTLLLQDPGSMSTT